MSARKATRKPSQLHRPLLQSSWILPHCPLPKMRAPPRTTFLPCAALRRGLTGGDALNRDRLGSLVVRLGDVLLGVQGRVEERVDEGRLAEARLACKGVRACQLAAGAGNALRPASAVARWC